MAKKKTELQHAIGKLISAIQKEWGNESGEAGADLSEDVMDEAHKLLQAGTVERIGEILGPMTIRQYLGDLWVQRHPAVRPALDAVEQALRKGRGEMADEG